MPVIPAYVHAAPYPRPIQVFPALGASPPCTMLSPGFVGLSPILNKELLETHASLQGRLQISILRPELHKVRVPHAPTPCQGADK